MRVRTVNNRLKLGQDTWNSGEKKKEEEKKTGWDNEW